MTKTKRKSSSSTIPKLTSLPNEKDFTPRKLPKFKARNAKQQKVHEDIINNDVNFVLGRVGTGKTFVAVHTALELQQQKEYSKIILIRANVSTEEIGFLKGTLEEKILPYLQSMIQPMKELLGNMKFEKMVEREEIVYEGLGFVRGLSYKNSIVIIDEIQNLTKSQLRLLLTRIEDNSKIILCGDITQCDLPNSDLSACHDIYRFKDKESLSINVFNKSEIVRSKICRIIDSCYDDDYYSHIKDDSVLYFKESQLVKEDNSDIQVYNYNGKYL